MSIPILITITAGGVIIYAVWRRQYRLNSVSPRPHTPDYEDICTLGCNTVDEDPRDELRVSFDVNFGANVKCFPSAGGLYERWCDALEMDFLGLDRFEPAPQSFDQAEEDALCEQMRLLGAKWWPSLDAYRQGRFQMVFRMTQTQEKVRFIGVANRDGAKGVWALETDELDCNRRGLGRIGNAVTMEERCRQIERFGGKFYADPRACPFLDFRGGP
ncbi:hypothetical protein VTI74DRAFT_3774 [Chaetomium olivicolor]